MRAKELKKSVWTTFVFGLISKQRKSRTLWDFLPIREQPPSKPFREPAALKQITPKPLGIESQAQKRHEVDFL